MVSNDMNVDQFVAFEGGGGKSVTAVLEYCDTVCDVNIVLESLVCQIEKNKPTN